MQKWKEFQAGDIIHYKRYRNNVWEWLPGTILRREGAVNYVVGTEAGADERQVRRHANQLKLRYISDPEEDNVLLDMFDLSPSLGTYEPLIIPHQQQAVAPHQQQAANAGEPTQESDADESFYEDAEEELQQPVETEVETEVEPEVAPPPRRSGRAAATKPEGFYKHFY